MKNASLNILHLYPDLLNLYGDLGNINALTYKSKLFGIVPKIIESTSKNEVKTLDEIDIIVMGGGSDREQKIVSEKLLKNKDEINKYINDGGVVLGICAGYQLLGNYYQTKSDKIDGLGILDMHTDYNEPRIVGNIILKSEKFGKIIGFENHSGRTYFKNSTLNQKLRIKKREQFEKKKHKKCNKSNIIFDVITKNDVLGKDENNFLIEDKVEFNRNFKILTNECNLGNNYAALGEIILGGENNDSLTEGVVYKNVVGTYLHGPLLPKNPAITDWMIQAALFKRFGDQIIGPVCNLLEEKARDYLIKRFI